MIKNFFKKIVIGLSCLCVMLLTLSLIAAFYTATFIRRLFVKKFVPHARKDTIDESEELIGSANAQINAIKASLEKQ